MTRSLSIALLTTTLAGCPSTPAQPDAEPCSFTLEWGREVDGVFTRFGDGDLAELTLGFQGFRYVVSAARLVGMSTEEMSFRFDIAVAGQAPWNQGGLARPEPASGDSYADYLLVFFNDVPIAELVGREATITARVDAGGCTGQDGAQLTLADDEQCVEQPDGGLTCD
jgi:hypothetical protein